MASSIGSVIFSRFFSGSASSHLPKRPKENLSSSPKPNRGHGKESMAEEEKD